MGDQDPWVDSDEEEVESTEEKQETTEEQEESPKEKEKKEPPKSIPEDEEWDFVDIKDEAVQRRFNRLYGQVKRQERVNQQAISDNKVLLDRLKALEAKLSEKEYNDSKNDIQRQIDALSKERKSAIEQGDDEEALRLTEELVELRRELKAPKKVEKAEEPEQPQEDPTLSDSDKETLVKWGFEKDARGNLKRPWFSEDHEDHIMAKKIAESILEEAGGPVDVADVLTELDRRMSRFYGRPKEKPTTVISGEKSKSTSKSISKEAEYVALKMFPNMKKADAINAYMKGMSDGDEE